MRRRFEQGECRSGDDDRDGGQPERNCRRRPLSLRILLQSRRSGAIFRLGVDNRRPRRGGAWQPVEKGDRRIAAGVSESCRGAARSPKAGRMVAAGAAGCRPPSRRRKRDFTGLPCRPTKICNSRHLVGGDRSQGGSDRGGRLQSLAAGLPSRPMAAETFRSAPAYALRADDSHLRRSRRRDSQHQPG